MNESRPWWPALHPSSEPRSPRASKGRPVAVVLLGVLMILAGCVSTEKRDVEKAQEALVACEAEHGIDHPECEEIRLRKKNAQERYEQKARERWACDPTQEQCPTPR